MRTVVVASTGDVARLRKRYNSKSANLLMALPRTNRKNYDLLQEMRRGLEAIELEIDDAKQRAEAVQEQRAAEAAAKGSGKRAADATECEICLDTFSREEMIQCCSNKDHVVCIACMSGHVKFSTRKEEIGAFERYGGVRCPFEDCGELCSKAEIARCGDGVFEHFSKAIKFQLERKVEADAEKRIAEQLEIRVKATLAKSEWVRAVEKEVQQVREDLLNVQCPQCRTVFADFDGCFSLKCSTCPSCHFCGYCLKAFDNSSNSHQHVRICEHNTNPGKYFNRAPGAFEEAKNKLRLRRLKKYFARTDTNLSLELQLAVLIELSRDLKELKIPQVEIEMLMRVVQLNGRATNNATQP